jgi:hypothetical protein
MCRSLWNHKGIWDRSNSIVNEKRTTPQIPTNAMAIGMENDFNPSRRLAVLLAKQTRTNMRRHMSMK